VPYNLPTVFPSESRAPTSNTPGFSSSRQVHIANLCPLPSTSEQVKHYLSFSTVGSEKIINAFPHWAELVKRRENNSTDTGITVVSPFVRITTKLKGNNKRENPIARRITPNKFIVKTRKRVKKPSLLIS